MAMMSQTKRILAYMEEFGSINPLQALSDIGCFRLAARIADLKEQGVPIVTEMVKSKNRYGKTVTFAQYSIEGKEGTACTTPSYFKAD